jgi:hypothetical protein
MAASARALSFLLEILIPRHLKRPTALNRLFFRLRRMDRGLGAARIVVRMILFEGATDGGRQC